jgi:hypothetical protein
MPFSKFAKMKLERAAAGLYMSEPNGSEATGLTWQELPPEDKELWMAKAAGKADDNKRSVR